MFAGFSQVFVGLCFRLLFYGRSTHRVRFHDAGGSFHVSQGRHITQIIRNTFRVEHGMSFLHNNCNLRRVHKIKEVLRDTAWSAVPLPDRTSSLKFLIGCLFSQNKGQ